VLDALQLVGQISTGQLSVMGGLGAQPVTGAEPQRAAEPQVGVGGDRPLAGDDLADAGGGHADRFGQAVMASSRRVRGTPLQGLDYFLWPVSRDY